MQITQAMKRASKQNFWVGVFLTFAGTFLSGYVLVRGARGSIFPLLDFSFGAAPAIGFLLSGVSSLMASKDILQNRIRPYRGLNSLVGNLLICYGTLGKGIHDGTMPREFLISLAVFMVVFTALLFIAVKQVKQKATIKPGK